MEENTLLFNTALVIEDDSSHAMLIKRALLSFVKSHKLVTTVAEGLESLKTEQPEVIITDLNLPDSSGVKHIEAFRSVVPDLPILVLTSSNSIKDAVQAMRLGARDFIVKNFDENFKEVLGLALSRVVNQNLLAAQKLKLERELLALRTAIENSQDGLAVVGRDGIVGYSNSAFDSIAMLLGAENNSINSLGKFAISGEKLAQDIKRHLLTLAPGSVWSTEITLPNREAAFDLNLSLSSSASGGPERCIIWIRDISERKRREKFQKDLLSTTTHDLKGPLGTISLCSEMLLDMVKDQAKIKEMVIRVASSARGGINLIDEFLSARRIQEGSLILRPSPVNIQDELEAAVSDHLAMAAAKKIKLTSSCKTEGSLVNVDKIALSRILSNLLSNAIKFTPTNGEVTVSLNLSEHDYQINVIDTGLGMEPSQVQKLFSRFSRLEQHKAIEGTGLGLFVVKSIVSAHGGKIEVQSKVGQGSCFTIILPNQPPVNERGELVSLTEC